MIIVYYSTDAYLKQFKDSNENILSTIKDHQPIVYAKNGSEDGIRIVTMDLD